MKNSIVDQMQSGKLNKIETRANLDYTGDLLALDKNGVVHVVYSYNRGWAWNSPVDMANDTINGIVFNDYSRDVREDLLKIAYTHILAISPAGSRYEEIEPLYKLYVEAGGQQPEPDSVRLAAARAASRAARLANPTRADRKKAEETKKLWKMAYAVVSSYAWDGTAKSASELISSVCAAEIKELYNDIEKAENDLDESVAMGELREIGNGKYERVRDGAIL